MLPALGRNVYMVHYIDPDRKSEEVFFKQLLLCIHGINIHIFLFHIDLKDNILWFSLTQFPKLSLQMGFMHHMAFNLGN